MHFNIPALLREGALRSIDGLGKTSRWEAQRQGLYVKPVKIGARAVAYPAHEIAALTAARIAGKSEAEIRTLVSKLHAARVSEEL